MKRFIFVLLFLVCGMAVQQASARRYYSENVNELCELPEEFNVNGQPMNLGYFYSKYSVFHVFVVGFDNGNEGKLVIYPRSQAGDVEEYLDIEEYLDNPEVSSLILQASGAKSLDELRRHTTFDIWCNRCTIVFCVIFFGIGGYAYIREKITAWRNRRKGNDELSPVEDA